MKMSKRNFFKSRLLLQEKMLSTDGMNQKLINIRNVPCATGRRFHSIPIVPVLEAPLKNNRQRLLKIINSPELS